MSYNVVSLEESKALVWVLGLCDGPVVSAMGPHDHLREVRRIQDPRIVRCPDFVNYTTPREPERALVTRRASCVAPERVRAVRSIQHTTELNLSPGCMHE